MKNTTPLGDITIRDEPNLRVTISYGTVKDVWFVYDSDGPRTVEFRDWA